MKRKIGKYELLGHLGSGGMAVVYKARDTSLDRVVALKLIRQQFEMGEVFRKRFLNEAKVLAGLQHSNIVHIYDFGIDEGAPYIVMEYLQGSDLYELVQKQFALSVEQKLKIAVQMAKALRAAHQQGVVHRDIKPSNIRVLPDGVAKLMDFGIAILPAQELDRLTQTGAILGSIRYMAPEQIHGQPATPQSDIFSLGAVLYELFAYRQAFPGDNLAKVVAAISNEVPPGLANPPHPVSLNRVIEGCMRKSPADRWPSVDRVLKKLTQIEEELWEAAQRDGSTLAGRMLLSDAEPLPQPVDQETVIVDTSPSEKATRAESMPWKKPTRKMAAPVELVPEATEVEEPEEPERSSWLWPILALLALAAAGGLGWFAWNQDSLTAGPSEELVLLPVAPIPTPAPPTPILAASTRTTKPTASKPARPTASKPTAKPTVPKVVEPEPTPGLPAPESVASNPPAATPTIPRPAPEPLSPTEALAVELQGSDRVKRLAAARALARLGREAVDPLMYALRNPETEVQILASTALGQIGTQANTAVPALAAVAAQGQPLARIWANYALARIDWMDPAAVAALKKAAQSEEPALREAANRALQDLERTRQQPTP